MKKKMLIITWVSWSWKTTLQSELIKRGWKTPLNFTTRAPRSDKELDEYVFINRDRFLYLLELGAFIDFTNWYWNWYWISSNLPDDNISLILDPAWREQVLQNMARIEHNYDIKCVYLDIDCFTQIDRLIKRWDYLEDVAIRGNDFKFFSPSIKSSILDWTDTTDNLVNKIEKWETLKKTS